MISFAQGVPRTPAVTSPALRFVLGLAMTANVIATHASPTPASPSHALPTGATPTELTPSIAPLNHKATPAARAALAASALAPQALLQIDGRLDEPAWSQAPAFDGFQQFLPQRGPWRDAAYRTEVRMLVVADALVFGIRAHDPRPQAIRAPLLRRDRVQRDQDHIGVFIDTSGEGRAAQFVRVSARGVVGDGMVIPGRAAKVEGNDGDEDPSPDFDVEAAAAIDSEGYTIELRWPLKALRLPQSDGVSMPKAWRILLMRSIPRESSVMLTSAWVPREALSVLAALQPLAGIEPLVQAGADAREGGVRSQLTVRPAFTWRGTRQRVDSEAAGSVQSTERRRGDLGVDLKWQPRTDWVIDATLNPDFSQVELDTPQLAGNTRFAISAIEKRPFFLESTDVLDLPLAAFYSRSMASPEAGLRATWRGRTADSTALVMRDEAGGLVLLPGPFDTRSRLRTSASDMALWRARWHGSGLGDDVGAEAGTSSAGSRPFTVGALLTSRQPKRGAGNQVVGVDASMQLNSALRVNGLLLASRTQAERLAEAPLAADAQTGAGQGTLAFVSLNRRGEEHGLNIEWQRVAPRFRNDNGFVEQAGAQRRMVEWIRYWGEQQALGVVAHEFETFVWFEERRALADPATGVNGQTISRRWHPGIWLTADRNLEAWAHAIFDAERVRPDGRWHTVRGVAGQVGFIPAPWFTRLQAEGQWGERVDVGADRVGRGHVLTVDAQWRADLPAWTAVGSARPGGIEVRQRWQQGRVDAPDGQRALLDAAWQTQFIWHLDTRDSVRATWQASRTVRSSAGVVEPLAALAAAEERSAVVSVVAQRRWSSGRNLALGWLRQDGRDRSESGGRVLRERAIQDEVFLKLSTQW